jgi:hypothetical protein
VHHAGPIQGVARGEVIRAIEDDVGIGEQRLQFVCFDSLLQRNDAHIRVQGGECGARGFDFRRADGIGAVENLPLQVGEVDLVRIGDGELADAAGGEIERRGAAEAAGANDECVRRAQPFLPFDPYFVEQDVATVAEELLVVQVVNVSEKINSPSPPAWFARPKAPGP